MAERQQPRRRQPLRERLPVWRGSGRLAGQTLAEQVLALLGALAARLLGALEEVRQLGVALALGVLLVGLEAQHVGQALLREPDDVVVLVLGAGDLTGLGLPGRHVCSPLVRVRSRVRYPAFRLSL